ncbi:endonuclease/exonuclease/phosphatase family protein [Arthrobacter sp. NEB 688]|uniref:endonuclease/exonuclease/phosphatase family protein n=1 Tax=Arthrobacter sp. NEB 688 TaxID=904039 RepID=UPI001566EF41|nr:endonuclease/exonuclease/phosphatase family protein [Arthrobacter sp. NEB 688]QKE85109.1 endonuclease/exonuclease/phosphatase family protein [Arthrobacter sp. NEB 688]
MAAAAPASAAPERVKIVQHNVEKKWSAIAAAVQLAADTSADGLTLQEVCKTDADRLISEHPGWTVNWRESRAGACSDGKAVGVAAILRGQAGADGLWPALPADTGRTVELVCVRYGATVKRFICSVHLAKGDPTARKLQTAAIKQITNQWINNQGSVVVGGDFNATPYTDEMDSMYALNGNGRFTEADQAAGRGGDVTSADGRKIDYVFFSQNRTSAVQAAGITVTSTDSDHKLLLAKADVTL